MKYLIILGLLLACSGYKLRSKKNPFSQFGISSITVPMFHNFSNIPNVSAVFTKSVFNSMLNYRELALYSGNHSSDAVLVGIIESRDKRNKTITPDTQKEVSNIYEEDLFEGKRDTFLLPTSNRIKLNLRIIIIKHPTSEELEFLKKSIAREAMSSKIIFNESIALNGSYNLRELKGSDSNETKRNIQVLGTQNKGVQQATIQSMAQNAASSFEDMILYAF